MAAAAAPGADIFDEYFRKADMDRDGRISGQEAVAFFQGSNLPKHVLAQIWMYADQNKIGYLGRSEFYNALRLVTVAQSGRELTQEIVKAALYGPAVSKIPAPKINYITPPGPQVNSVVPPLVRPVAPMGPPAGIVPPQTPQNFGIIRPQPIANIGLNQQILPSGNQYLGALQPRPATAPVPIQVVSQGQYTGVNISGSLSQPAKTTGLQTDWLGGKASGTSAGGMRPPQMPTTTALPVTGQELLSSVRPATTPGLNPQSNLQSALASSIPRPQATLPSSIQTVSKDSRELGISGDGFSANSLFGGDIFSASSQDKKAASASVFSSVPLTTISTGNAPISSTVTSVASQPQGPNQFGLNALQSSLSAPVIGHQLTQSLVKDNQLNTMQSTLGVSSVNVTVKNPNPASSEPQVSWKKITQADIQKYNKVFLEVDKDRDGKITGEQARNLFLSWKLPREVLKQVWDLSDQDNDSMLSLREFCFALYLMERYREGQALPAVLPDSLKFDETLLRSTGGSFGVPAWQATPGLAHQQRPGLYQAMSTAGMRPPLHPSYGNPPTIVIRPEKQPLPLPLAEIEQSKEPDRVDSKIQEAPLPEKEILDSREKIEFYRTKMQELVLYKSRCDNRLNEITERASADKREVESLTKKYEEKYKQVGDVASKLVVEEARFRDIQERKSELQNAILKVEQGGSADGLLQVRADRIQSDLEELEKALNQRCKQHSVDVKPTTTIELPFGWQTGVPEDANDWDEEWDKFEDEGFTIANDLMVNEDNPTATAKSISSLTQDASCDELPSKTNGRMHKSYGSNDQFMESESGYTHSEEGSTRSPQGSPERTVFASPTEDLYNAPYDDLSSHSKENHRDKYADEHSWGAAFDTSDDRDSVWGFGASESKESDHEKSGQSPFFDSGDFGLNPIRVDSPSAGSLAGKGKSSFFADSAPGSPLFASSSPPRFSDSHQYRSFDSFGRFDSFRTNDSGLFSRPENFSRFDSISSTRDSGHSPNVFQSFDDADPDPFGTGGVKHVETTSPRRDSDHWNTF